MKLIYKLAKTKLKVCVIDNQGGSYLPIAKHLTKYFDVYYHSVVQNPYPQQSVCNVGLGYPDIKIVRNFWSNVDNFDLIVFTDIYFKDWGTHLRKMGKLVWGGCQSEDLETDRKLFKEELLSVKLDVAGTKYIVGIDNLIKELTNQKDKWLKVSYYRGNFETFHHININQSMVFFNDLKVSLGPLGNILEFVVEDALESIAEVGYDGYSVNGLFPDEQIWGVETKDCSYVGTHVDRSKMPEPVQNVNGKFASILQKYNHIGFFSSEIRVGNDGKDYFTDPCMRAGSPPSNTYMNMINNWDEILIGGAKGEMIQPTYAGKYGCELIIKSSYQFDNYMPVQFDKKYYDNINLKASIIVDGKNYVIPFDQAGLGHMVEFGSVVCIGNEVDSILNQTLEIANSIEAFGLMFDADALSRSKKSIEDITNALKIKF